MKIMLDDDMVYLFNKRVRTRETSNGTVLWTTADGKEYSTYGKESVMVSRYHVVSIRSLDSGVQIFRRWQP
jgi:hypothetical protein